MHAMAHKADQGAGPLSTSGSEHRTAADRGNPQSAAAACFHRGVEFLKQGRFDLAEPELRRAIVLAPHFAEAHAHLATIMELNGEPDKAVSAYQRSLELRHDQPHVHTQLGDALHRSGLYHESLQAYGAALELLPNDLDTLNNLGLTLKVMGHLEEAEQCYRSVLRLDPRYTKARDNLGLVLLARGETKEAVRVFRETVQLGLQDSRAEHLLDAVNGGLSERVPQNYVRQLFDAAAPSFERHLVQQLGYDLPTRIARTLHDTMPARTFSRALDLGCGTGLVGDALQGLTQEIHGIDLSSKMLMQAEQRTVYQQLNCMDIIEYLREEPRGHEHSNRYDLVVAADVFIYLGDLDELFSLVHSVLQPGGVFVFSVELALEGLYQLRQTGRFSHSQKYVQNVAHGRFSIERSERFDLRLEQGKPLSGMLFVLFPKMT